MDENEDEKLARMLQSQFDQVPFLNQNTFDLTFKIILFLDHARKLYNQYSQNTI